MATALADRGGQFDVNRFNVAAGPHGLRVVSRRTAARRIEAFIRSARPFIAAASAAQPAGRPAGRPVAVPPSLSYGRQAAPSRP